MANAQDTQDAAQHPQSVHNDLLSLVFPKLALDDKLNLSLINSKMYERMTNTPQMYARIEPLWRSLEEVFSWINNCALYFPLNLARAADEIPTFLITYNKDNILIFTLAYKIESKLAPKIELKDLIIGEQYLLKIKNEKIEAIYNMIIPTSKILINQDLRKFERFTVLQYRPASAEINRVNIYAYRREKFIRIKDILAAIKYFLPDFVPSESGNEASYYTDKPIGWEKITYHSIDSTTIHINIIFHKYSIMIYDD